MKLVSSLLRLRDSILPTRPTGREAPDAPASEATPPNRRGSRRVVPVSCVWVEVRSLDAVGWGALQDISLGGAALLWVAASRIPVGVAVDIKIGEYRPLQGVVVSLQDQVLRLRFLQDGSALDIERLRAACIGNQLRMVAADEAAMEPAGRDETPGG